MMKKLVKMFALTLVLCAPMFFTACQEEEIIEPKHVETGDSHDSDGDRDGVEP